MMALFGNLSLLEIVLIAALSVMIFGRNLPRTAAQLYSQFVRARRALRAVWQDSGLGEEFRQVHREMERTADTVREQSPDVLVRDMVRDVEEQVQKPGVSTASGDASDSPGTFLAPGAELAADRSIKSQDEAPIEEGADGSATPEEPEAPARPPWYPDSNDNPFSKDS